MDRTVEFVVLAGLYFHLMLTVKCNCCCCIIETGNNMQQSNGIPTVSCIRSLLLMHLSELSRRAVALHGCVTCLGLSPMCSTGCILPFPVFLWSSPPLQSTVITVFVQIFKETQHLALFWPIALILSN